MLLQEIANKLGLKVIGEAQKDIVGIANLITAKENEISFLSDHKMLQHLSSSKAGAVIVKEEHVIENAQTTFLVSKDPYVSFAKLAQLFDTTPPCAEGIAESAVIHPTAVIGQNVAIGPNAVIEANAQIGDGAQLGALSYVGKNAKIGKNTKLWSNVSIYHDCIVGDNCLFQSGAVIGSDGFGYANERGQWVKIPQLGRVIIGNNVEIGSNTSVDRGALDDTIIEDNVIIDNLVQVAHNDHIGYGSAIAGGTIIAGSVELGKYCIVGGTSTFNGHIKICDGVQVLGQVAKSINKPGRYTSYLPVMDNLEWIKVLRGLLKTPKMIERLGKLEELVADKNKE